ncbi:hypothetical protein [uncultured Desulfovibrio sp.]|uniref:hypothetical protein n=1 Tax=uncultured Desulfovibrio sp. TaxID=167968 RepID=UPI002625D355|nr:hypothetical protein [uncultured Desulfovibrio sp.]
MVKTGLPLNFVKFLQRSDNIREELLQGPSGIRYAKALQKTASEMTLALKARDFETLLAMEKLAVQRDFREFGTELAQKSENGHKQIMERWRIVSNPMTAREDFQATYAPENLPKARVMDAVMESLIKTQCRRLSDYAKGNATPAEKLYFTRRAECLKAVYKEHMRHLEQALGQGKALGKGLER